MSRSHLFEFPPTREGIAGVAHETMPDIQPSSSSLKAICSLSASQGEHLSIRRLGTMSRGIRSCLGHINPRISLPADNRDLSLSMENPGKVRVSSPFTYPLPRHNIKNGSENADEDTMHSPRLKKER
jgi:hypothetical protein